MRFQVNALGFRLALGEHSFHDVTVDVGEAKLTALIAERMGLVVDTAEVHEGGLHVVDVDAIRGDIPAEVIGFAEGDSGIDAAAADKRAAFAEAHAIIQKRMRAFLDIRDAIWADKAAVKALLEPIADVG